MRISSQQIFDTGLSSLQQHTSDVVEAQRQISSGQKYSRASDSALAAGLGVQMTFDSAQYDMFKINQEHCDRVYATADTQLKSMFDAMASFQQTLVQASNGTLSAENRQILGAKAQKIFDTVASLAGVSKNADGSWNQSGGKWNLRPDSIFNNTGIHLDGTAYVVESPGNSSVALNIELQNGLAKFDVLGISTQEFKSLFPSADTSSESVKSFLARHVDVLGLMQQMAQSLETGSAPSPTDLVAIDQAIKQVTYGQVQVGLLQNQLEAATQWVESQKLNTETARSNLLDTDLAQATSQLAKSNALLQAAQAIITKLDTNTLFQKL